MPGTLGAYLFHRGVIEFIAKRDAPVERAS
jgi:hypothetical protein